MGRRRWRSVRGRRRAAVVLAVMGALMVAVDRWWGRGMLAAEGRPRVMAVAVRRWRWRMRTAVRGWAIVIGRRHAVVTLGRRAAHQLRRARWVRVEVRVIPMILGTFATLFPRDVTTEWRRRRRVVPAEGTRSIEAWRRRRTVTFPLAM